MTWWQSLLRLVGAASDADAEDAARAKRRKAAARRAGEIAADAERQAEEARSRARKCNKCLGTGAVCAPGGAVECPLCRGEGVV